MKLIVTLLGCWLVVVAADDSLSLGGGKVPDGKGFPKPIGPRVAKQFVTNHHRHPTTYNPCVQKECSPGYSCKAVTNQYLLQVSIAVCVPDNVMEIAENPPCLTIVLGGGQMGCKTQEEWEKIGSIQCGIRVTTDAAYQHKTKVNNHCAYGRYKPEHTFMQAEINCCPTEPTTAPTTTTIATIPPYDYDGDLDIGDDVNERRNIAPFILVFAIGFAMIGFIMLMIGCLAYRRHQQNHPAKPRPLDGGMSYINHNSDAYEESNFNPKKPLVMYPADGSNAETYVVENPLVSSQ